MTMNSSEGCEHGEALPRLTLPAAVQPNRTDEQVFAFIDSRRLERECFVRSIELLHPRLIALSYASAEDCVEAAASSPPTSAVLFNVGARQLSDPELRKEIGALLNCENASPVVLLAPWDDLDHVIAALDTGAVGYVTSDLGIDAIVESTKLAASGGVFLRVESLAKLRSSRGAMVEVPPEFGGLTDRQAAVADALRRGKPTKMIAYELNMCESTVKVHIRKIMQKLKSTNRTEAAFKLNSIRF